MLIDEVTATIGQERLVLAAERVATAWGTSP